MNKTFLMGNLVRDPDFSTTSNGISNCKFSIAVPRRFKNEKGESEVDFLNIVTWRGLADNCSKFLHKGNKVLVVGSLQTRTYDAKDGTKRYVFEVLANNVEFLDNKTTTEPVKTEASQKQEIMQGFTPIEDEGSLPF